MRSLVDLYEFIGADIPPDHHLMREGSISIPALVFPNAVIIDALAKP